MKTSKTLVPVSFIVLLLLAWVFVPAGEAAKPGSTEPTEQCYETSTGGIVTLVFTDTGAGHSVVNGRYEYDGRVEALIGAAEVSDGTMYATINSSGSDATTSWGNINHIELDTETQTGTLDAFNLYHVDDNPDPGNIAIRYERMSLWAISCS